ncbi:hypothetical protein T11_10340 [Trichinella zimbabwensis]|uniref:Uncharacterized protein n=1 Tax=Trichinella zimbabwensis TaxID=268475 RepID=A0A0V1GB46_9BILA|nr:hypothetical protein T11_10340 [Trichinella zimbabwensis]
MLLENSRKREKEGEDSLAENFSVLDKKRQKPCIIGERKTTRHGQNGADLVV